MLDHGSFAHAYVHVSLSSLMFLTNASRRDMAETSLAGHHFQVPPDTYFPQFLMEPDKPPPMPQLTPLLNETLLVSLIMQAQVGTRLSGHVMFDS
jgi:hypothetical protein